MLSSVLAQRFHASAGGLVMSNPSVRSLVLELGGTLRLILSASECDYESYVSENYTLTADSERNIPLQIDLRQFDLDKEHIISDIYCSMALTNVQNLHVRGPPTSLVFWKRILGHFQDLRHLKISVGDMPKLASILSLALDDSTGDLTRQANGGSNPMFAPVLEKLELCKLAFTAESHVRNTETQRADLPSLQDALSTRKDPPVRLEMSGCVEYAFNEDSEEENNIFALRCNGLIRCI